MARTTALALPPIPDRMHLSEFTHLLDFKHYPIMPVKAPMGPSLQTSNKQAYKYLQCYLQCNAPHHIQHNQYLCMITQLTDFVSQFKITPFDLNLQVPFPIPSYLPLNALRDGRRSLLRPSAHVAARMGPEKDRGMWEEWECLMRWTSGPSSQFLISGTAGSIGDRSPCRRDSIADSSRSHDIFEKTSILIFIEMGKRMYLRGEWSQRTDRQYQMST
jgi:hypothetical protein